MIAASFLPLIRHMNSDMEEEAQPEAVDKRIIQMRRVLLDVGPPSVAHHVGWIRAGNEILLEIGYLDHRAIHEHMKSVATEDSSPVEVEWFVTNRFMFTRDHAPRLAAVFGELTRMLEALKDDQSSGTDAND
jgi:hypothetical protein